MRGKSLGLMLGLAMLVASSVAQATATYYYQPGYFTNVPKAGTAVFYGVNNNPATMDPIDLLYSKMQLGFSHVISIQDTGGWRCSHNTLDFGAMVANVGSYTQSKCAYPLNPGAVHDIYAPGIQHNTYCDGMAGGYGTRTTNAMYGWRTEAGACSAGTGPYQVWVHGYYMYSPGAPASCSPYLYSRCGWNATGVAAYSTFAQSTINTGYSTFVTTLASALAGSGVLSTKCILGMSCCTVTEQSNGIARQFGNEFLFRGADYNSFYSDPWALYSARGAKSAVSPDQLYARAVAAGNTRAPTRVPGYTACYSDGQCGTRCGTFTECGYTLNCPPCGSCFTAGTQVTMADGSLRSIEQVKVGEQVLAYDTATSTAVAKKVQHVFVHPDTPGSLLLNGTIEVTGNHRVYANGTWVRADQLQVGDVLVMAPTAMQQPTTVVHSLESLSGMPQTTYNLDVEGLHTYFAGGVLVHNMAKEEGGGGLIQ